MYKLLEILKIVQVVSNEDRRKKGLKRLGNGYSEAYRLNPYNPLSYIVMILTVLYFFIMYGVYGLIKRYPNPFHWD